jgi:cell fate (sporulation/competence/biofilm development) regulator YlbF (YheA/YmcA/DUF963 family)
MKNQVNEDIEIASPSVVKQAAHDFASALAETPQFKNFELADFAFRQDQAGQQALQALQQKQQSLRPLMLLNALNNEQREELQHLQSVFVNQPVVQKYFTAQADLSTLCQALGDELSQAIGLNYAAVCAASCCG